MTQDEIAATIKESEKLDWEETKGGTHFKFKKDKDLFIEVTGREDMDTNSIAEWEQQWNLAFPNEFGTTLASRTLKPYWVRAYYGTTAKLVRQVVLVCFLNKNGMEIVLTPQDQTKVVSELDFAVGRIADQSNNLKPCMKKYGIHVAS